MCKKIILKNKTLQTEKKQPQNSCFVHSYIHKMSKYMERRFSRFLSLDSQTKPPKTQLKNQRLLILLTSWP